MSKMSLKLLPHFGKFFMHAKWAHILCFTTIKQLQHLKLVAFTCHINITEIQISFYQTTANTSRKLPRPWVTEFSVRELYGWVWKNALFHSRIANIRNWEPDDCQTQLQRMSIKLRHRDVVWPTSHDMTTHYDQYQYGSVGDTHCSLSKQPSLLLYIQNFFKFWNF